MRVCMLAYTFYASDMRVMRYAEALAQRGDVVDVLALRRPGESSQETINGVNVFRIHTRVVNEKRLWTYAARISLFLLRSMIFLSTRHLRNPYQLIHVHSVPDFLVLAAWIPRLMGAKVILDIHDLLPEFYCSKFKAKQRSLTLNCLVAVERLSIALADHVIVANHIWQKKLLSRSAKKGKCSVILNFPDSTIFSPLAERKRNEKFIIMFPGTLNWHQGVDIAVRAFALIKEEAPQAEFHIHGEGPAKQSLIDLVTNLKLQDRVLFKEFLSVREIARVIQQADLAVVPKRASLFGDEAFSTKILEFMSAGVPVIVSETKVDRYYFNDSVVKFVRPEELDEWASAMLQLVRGKTFREKLSRNALKFVAQYDWAKHRAGYLGLVDRLCQKQAFSPRLAQAPLRESRGQGSSGR